ncbi:hypothetical protein OJ253_2446 [Cryptosporidium canis]|uniref:Uncharacterized protein n=1 Tax=Cryptosporidium canis TaxID=195482 RepID=A0A9D5DI65_9CRYT|nr:hypothetical protein OJ253_2446 [Cryptosporidium canis]
MSGPETGFIEDEANEIVILLDSQDQEQFSTVENIINEENILIEGLVWVERPTLDQSCQARQIESKETNDLIEELTPMVNTSEEFGDDDLEYAIINNLEEIELENRVSCKSASEDENSLESRDKSLESPKKEECLACIPRRPTVLETGICLKLESQRPNHSLKNVRLETLISRLLFSSQTQVFVHIRYLKRVEEISRNFMQGFRKCNKSVILDISKKRNMSKGIKMKLPRITSLEDPLSKNEPISGRNPQLADLVLPSDSSIGEFELQLPSTSSPGINALESNKSTAEASVLSEADKMGKLETECQIVEIFEDQDRPKEEVVVTTPNTERESNIPLDPELYGNELPATQEIPMNGVPESKSISEPEVPVDEQIVGSQNSIIEIEYRESQNLQQADLQLGTPNYELNSVEHRAVPFGPDEHQPNSPIVTNERKMEESEPHHLVDPHEGQEDRNLNVAMEEPHEQIDEKASISMDLIEEINETEGVHELVASQLNYQDTSEEERGALESEDQSIKSLESKIKGAPEYHDLLDIAGFEENVGHCGTPAKSEYNQAEIFGKADQKDCSSVASPTSDQQKEAKVDTNEDKDHAEDIFVYGPSRSTFDILKDLQNKKSTALPSEENLEDEPNHKHPKYSPYDYMHRKKKSFGVFDKLISLAQNRNTVRPISNDLSIESIRAIEIIKKSRKPK